jgi:hypothetical protein
MAGLGPATQGHALKRLHVWPWVVGSRYACPAMTT